MQDILTQAEINALVHGIFDEPTPDNNEASLSPSKLAQQRWGAISTQPKVSIDLDLTGQVVGQQLTSERLNSLEVGDSIALARSQQLIIEVAGGVKYKGYIACNGEHLELKITECLW
ncbi:FliM/FliN family flagellar motor switch protein [Paraferrimonas haliotis]|uniref:Flagellar motor switch protein FliN-like C-terminal domain-containing protein n=1 Tax=Paraferrimonas haliotis TaxID=2013866 RepID=A0AA37TWI8_9GAMM|nr:FliM/FliN family flagellar motor switch protein [Paraferrimonas haliotis]GLS84130.1 hypothetical protein GCM10007894_21070 [Paraferrimonas haliotis]